MKIQLYFNFLCGWWRTTRPFILKKLLSKRGISENNQTRPPHTSKLSKIGKCLGFVQCSVSIWRRKGRPCHVSSVVFLNLHNERRNARPSPWYILSYKWSRRYAVWNLYQTGSFLEESLQGSYAFHFRRNCAASSQGRTWNDRITNSTNTNTNRSWFSY